MKKQKKGNRFEDKHKIKEFIASWAPLQEMLKESLEAEGKWYQMEASTYTKA